MPLPAQTQAPFVYFYAICHSRRRGLAVSGGLPAAEQGKWGGDGFLGLVVELGGELLCDFFCSGFDSFLRIIFPFLISL